MSPMIVDLLFGLSTAALGAGAAWALCRPQFHWNHREQASCKARHAAEVLTRLQDLATRMAIDVGQHSSQVEEINEQLTSTEDHKSAEIVEVVADLIQANQQMRERLATTEDRLREQAQQIEIHAAEARTDALTLLANRRAFDDELARRVAELRRHGRAFSLMMIDVDHFKKFNDAHGHQAGDDVLRSAAKLLRRKMRDMDLVARYGGEEFAIVLPGTSMDDACKAALRAREALEKTRFRYGGEDLHVTASVGVAEATGEESEAAIVMRADMALYASKQGGRNCVHAHDGQGIRPVACEPDPKNSHAARESRPASDVPAREPKTARHVVSLSEPTDGHPAGDEPLGTLPDLPSRTTFCQQVRNRIAEWKRGGPTFSVLLAAIDQFDQDPQRRDATQRDVTTLALKKHLVATVREMDLVAHYAPGCLALLLPSAEIDDTIHIAERLREAFPQSYAGPDAGPRRRTLSVAVAQVAAHDDTIALLRRAESALDAAGRRGGDRVYYHDGERCKPIAAMLEAMDHLA